MQAIFGTGGAIDGFDPLIALKGVGWLKALVVGSYVHQQGERSEEALQIRQIDQFE
jgi:hypothetical protein